ncbi:MAG TPA: circadian clock protein KaiC [Candidatus Aenigmarchaeota archaeon]|nr:circadian clock protein KaiC [Candidatus Aenigmarchaeota archaeon]
MERRIKTYIPGLDDILHGGFLESDLVLVTGNTGTGKTILACQYLYNSLRFSNAPGVFVSFEERPEDVKKHMEKFGWYFDKYEEEGMIIFVKYDPLHIEDVYGLIENNILEIGAERVVIDSITGLGFNIKDPSNLRSAIFNVGRILKKLGCTSILTSEIPTGNPRLLSTFGVEEHVADDVIVLYRIPRETSFTRAIHVWKMRGSPHSEKIHPYTITEKGIVVYSKEETIVPF